MKKILIIDDSNTIAKSLEILLKGSTLKSRISGIDISNDGKGGLEKVKNLKPNLIFLDIEMPGVHGFETLVEIKKMMSPQYSPTIIMISTHNSQEDVIKSIKNGAQDYILKPFNEKTLLDKIGKYF